MDVRQAAGASAAVLRSVVAALTAVAFDPLDVGRGNSARAAQDAERHNRAENCTLTLRDRKGSRRSNERH